MAGKSVAGSPAPVGSMSAARVVTRDFLRARRTFDPVFVGPHFNFRAAPGAFDFFGCRLLRFRIRPGTFM